MLHRLSFASLMGWLSAVDSGSPANFRAAGGTHQPRAADSVGFHCTTDTDCYLQACGSARRCSCHGVTATCRAGTCKSAPGVELCYTAGGSAPSSPNETVTTGGVQLFVNMQTSVVGFVAIEVLHAGGLTAEDYALSAADPLKGSATNAVASWGGGAFASLSGFAGQEISLKVTMADAKLFSLRLGCA